MDKKKQFVITKKIAKHGRQAVIVIPAVLMEESHYIETFLKNIQ